MISGPLNSLKRAICCRLYGKANTPKSKPGTGGPARKQVLMKRKRAMSAPASFGQAAGHSVQSRIASLTDALFEPSQPVQIIPDPVAPEERAILVPYKRADESNVIDETLAEKERIIRQTWARYCAKRAHEGRIREGKLLAARIRALGALREVSEKWYEEAIKIDYALAPPHRRIATFTMPRELNISSAKGQRDNQEGIKDLT
jgi:hypothetical protein